MNNDYESNVKDILFFQELLHLHTPSGYEKFCNPNLEILLNKWIPLIPFKIDNIGNIIWKRGSTNSDALKIMISAHYDENALQVINITDDGMLNITNLGGIDRKTIYGSHLFVVSDRFEESSRALVPAIIGKKPIHKESKDERGKIEEYEDILVDIGASSKEDVINSGIHIGSPVVFKKNVDLSFGTKNNLVLSNGLDDKVGVYIISHIFNVITNDELINKNIQLIMCWTSQEEVGLRGSTVIAKNINPDISIDVDVTFDTSKSSHISKSAVGDVELGKGVVLEYGPHSNFNLLAKFKDIANRYALPYQEYVAKSGGNNTSAIQTNSLNCMSVQLSIPQKNMHTPVEICNWDDIKSCMDIILYYINEKNYN